MRARTRIAFAVFINQFLIAESQPPPYNAVPAPAHRPPPARSRHRFTGACPPPGALRSLQPPGHCRGLAARGSLQGQRRTCACEQLPRIDRHCCQSRQVAAHSARCNYSVLFWRRNEGNRPPGHCLATQNKLARRGTPLNPWGACSSCAHVQGSACEGSSGRAAATPQTCPHTTSRRSGPPVTALQHHPSPRINPSLPQTIRSPPQSSWVARSSAAVALAAACRRGERAGLLCNGATVRHASAQRGGGGGAAVAGMPRR